MDDKRFALLIDAENISAKYIKYVLDEVSKYGIVTYKRIYGDWTKQITSSWKSELLENSISPIQQFSYTTGKNASDSALIIDAMDILYTKNVDGFCIVSSDSDFTKLASRLRESGMTVIGMGENKTPRSFRAACDRFTCLDILIDDDMQERKENEKQSPMRLKKVDSNLAVFKQNAGKKGKATGNKVVILDKKTVENAIIKIISENENEGKPTGLGEVGSRILKMYPDFDVRNYGYSLLSKFLQEFSTIHLSKSNNCIYVERVEKKSNKNQLEDYVINLVTSTGEEGILLGELGNKIHNKYKDFNVRNFGYSSFMRYINDMHQVEIRENEGQQKIVSLASTKKEG